MREKLALAFAFSGLLLLPGARAGAAPATAVQATTAEKSQISHILNRIAFGPRPGDIDRIQKTGVRQYIEEQLYPERIDDRGTENRLARLDSLHLSTSEILKQYPAPQQLAQQLGMRNLQAPQAEPGQQGQAATDQKANRAKLRQYMISNGLKQPQLLLQELQSQKIIRAVYSDRQLQEVMTDFWYNHFNVYWNKGADKWLTTDFEMNAIRPHALGKFKDLLMATAKSSAMLFFLDNHLSFAPGPLGAAAVRVLAKRQPGINENYARELMELHTMGVDGGYTQKDVQEVARAFTGWTIAQPRQVGDFMFRPAMHDRGEKVVLGQTIPAGGGITDGEKVIDILAHQPSTARFIATKLVRHFVSDTPPQALIDKVAATYTKTDGDIREMLRTIFYSDEFMSPKAYGQKTKSPFEYTVSSIRALGGETNGNPQIAKLIGKMGQPIYEYQAPTGFPDRADYWINSGSVLERINFATALASNQVPQTRVDISPFKDPKAAALYLGSPEFQKR